MPLRLRVRRDAAGPRRRRYCEIEDRPLNNRLQRIAVAIGNRLCYDELSEILRRWLSIAPAARGDPRCESCRYRQICRVIDSTTIRLA